MRSTRPAAPRPPATSWALCCCVEIVPAELAPARQKPLDHAHGDDHFGIAAARLGQPVARRGTARPPPGPARVTASRLEPGQDDEHERAGERGHADPEMERKADARDRAASTAGRTAPSGRRPTRTSGSASRSRTGCWPSSCPDLQRQPDDRVVDARAKLRHRAGRRCGPAGGRARCRAAPGRRTERPPGSHRPTSVGTLRLGSTRS